MQYNFNEVIERRNTNCMNTDGFRKYIFHADDSMQFPFRDDEFVRMWIADMEFSTPQVIIDAIKERADKRIFGYTKVFDPKYYEAFAAWCKKKYSWHFEKKHLLTSHGIIPALYELVEYITQPDEKVLILTPSYAYFMHAINFNHRKMVCSDMVNDHGYYTIDYEDLASKAADPKTTLMIFCNPHNPSGRVWSERELKRVAEICRTNNLALISDEIHCDLIRKGQQHIPMAKIMPDYDRIITCMAPSKTFNMAGLMFSNVIIPNDEIRSRWTDRHYDFENPLSIAAAQAAYEYGYDWLDALQDYLDNNFNFLKDYLAQNLPQAVYRIPEATYLAWVNVGAYLPADINLPEFFAFKAGVLLEGGNMFVQNSDSYIRLNLAMPRSMLKSGLDKIVQALISR